MESILSVVIVMIFTVLVMIKKKDAFRGNKDMNQTSSAMPHKHKPEGHYDTFNKKTKYNTAGAQPHVHSSMKYKPMPDINTLPKGYILLNGEPVRVADLEGK
ncbi:MAG: hypothetical protein K6E91_09895 [Butyrivibrio sp.]|nr:hypothetical protein [Butyrivibrio sp.]